MIIQIDQHHPVFPSPCKALKNPDGLLCSGGNLEIDTLLTAYQLGIFPWFSDGQPILWWSPDPRMILFPENLHISSSMKKWMKKKLVTVTWNKNFSQVIHECALFRKEGTWITKEMINAYCHLHRQGYAKSIEIWSHGHELVGGLYGVAIGKMFFGESMFSRVPNASKQAFISLAKEHHFKMIDCQFHTEHLESLGAHLMSRTIYLEHLKKILSL